MTGQVEFSCQVQEVFSGDDLIVMVDLGVENLYKKQRIRLSGVDTPSAINATPDTDAGQIRTHVRALVRGKKATITLVTKNTNSWVCILVVDTPNGPMNVNEELISKGYEYKRQ